ncbi:phage tail domain-containing protein, partial [Bacillus manliponensis]|uniref:phage tail domain-containing protein n=2 Tax=Bacillus manliponensis TaxID=574376 RepID=UPI0039F1134B
MRIKEMVCTNTNGDSLVISKSSHFQPIEDFDTTSLKVNNTYVTNNGMQGARPVASRLEPRDFSLLFFIDVKRRDEDWIQARRDEIFKVFNPIHHPIRLQFKTATRELFIDVEVETTPAIAPDRSNTNYLWHKVLVQLKAGNPNFQSAIEKRKEIALWVPNFSFPLQIPEGGIEMGYRSQSLIVNVLNEGQIETGMTIQFRALGTIEKPSLVNVNTQEELKINKSMAAGEVITVNTRKGQ